MTKICWISQVASPYKMRLFSLLSQKVDLVILLEDRPSDKRNASWYSYEHGKAELITFNEDYKKKIRECAEGCDLLIDSCYSTKPGMYAVSAFKKQHKICIMHADGGIGYKRPFPVNSIVSYFMKRHDYAFSSGPITDRYFRFYGYPQEQILHYRMTSFSEKEIQENIAMSARKAEYRKELNLPDRYTFISVGRSLHRKGFDLLLKAYKEAGLDQTCSLLIVGGEATEDLQKIIDEEKVQNVRFYPFIASDELKKYYAASDAFILCTREEIWGLVINEALSFRLPVITSDNCVAGIHFREEGEDVLIVKNEDIQAYAQAMKEVHERKETVIGSHASDSYSLENSAEDFTQDIQEVCRRAG